MSRARRLPRFSLLAATLLVVLVPLLAGTGRGEAWGDAFDVRYKIKPSDGNLWHRAYARGNPTRGDTPGRQLLLTFDDGPFPSTTPQLLDLLDELHLKVVFFVLGHRLAGNRPENRRNREILREAWRRGHVIGNHGFSHHTMTALPIEEQEREVVRTEHLIQEVIGERPWIYRPPGGRLDARGIRMVMDHGYTIAWWRLDSNDWQGGTPEQIAARVTSQLQGPRAHGGIILFHDTHSASRDAARLVVEWVRHRNRQLLRAGEQPFEFTGFETFFEPRNRPASRQAERAMQGTAHAHRPRPDGGAPALDAGHTRGSDAGHSH